MANADIRALAEETIRHASRGTLDGEDAAIVHNRTAAPELARFAIAVLDALDEAQRGTYWRDHAAVEAIRAAIARNMANRGAR